MSGTRDPLIEGLEDALRLAHEVEGVDTEFLNRAEAGIIGVIERIIEERSVRVNIEGLPEQTEEHHFIKHYPFPHAGDKR